MASSSISTTLTPQIVTGPAHGVLAQNADGTYSYTPVAKTIRSQAGIDAVIPASPMQ